MGMGGKVIREAYGKTTDNGYASAFDSLGRLAHEV